MKPTRTLAEITDKEVERFMLIEDISITKRFLVILLLSFSIGYIIGGLYLASWGVVITSFFKFLILPFFFQRGQKVTKRHDPEGYHDMLEWKRKEYYKKYYG